MIAASDYLGKPINSNSHFPVTVMNIISQPVINANNQKNVVHTFTYLHISRRISRIIKQQAFCFLTHSHISIQQIHLPLAVAGKRRLPRTTARQHPGQGCLCQSASATERERHLAGIRYSALFIFYHNNLPFPTYEILVFYAQFIPL